MKTAPRLVITACGILPFTPLLAPLKALVWFWLIDETLSANLVYLSEYEIGYAHSKWWSKIEVIMMVMVMEMIKCSGLKKKKEKNKRLKAKV